MHVIECSPPNSTERRLIELVNELNGVALCGYLPPVTRPREVDMLVIRPHSILTIEAKYSSFSGILKPSNNGPWTVSGNAPLGLGNPTSQARRQAQVIAPLIKTCLPRIKYIPAAVFVAGDLQIAGSIPNMEVRPLVSDTIVKALKEYSNIKDALTIDEVVQLFDVLDVPAVPSPSELTKQGFHQKVAPRQHSHSQTPRKSLYEFSEELVASGTLDTELITYLQAWSKNRRVTLAAVLVVSLWNQRDMDEFPVDIPNDEWDGDILELRCFISGIIGSDDPSTTDQLANLLRQSVDHEWIAVPGEWWAGEFMQDIWAALERRGRWIMHELRTKLLRNGQAQVAEHGSLGCTMACC